MKKHESKVEKKVEYGIFKFKIPNKLERTNAMGLVGENTLLKKLLTCKLDYFYDLIKTPEYGDWLMLHKEFGQTFDEFSKTTMKPMTNERNTIYLVSIAYSNNSNMNPDFIMGLKMLTEAFFYGVKVKLINKVYDLNEYKLNTKMNVDSGKIQISSIQIASLLYQELPNDAYCVIAFTDQDLYNGSYDDDSVNYDNTEPSQSNINKKSPNQENSNLERSNIEENKEEVSNINSDKILKENNNENNKNNIEENDVNIKKNIDSKECNVVDQNGTVEVINNIPLSNSFAYEYSSVKQRVCVFSFARYDPLFYTSDFDKDKNGGQELIQKFFSILLKRSCKVLINKIGQMMGLKNCIYYSCCMNGSNSMEEFDNKPLEFCPVCIRKAYFVICNKSGKNKRISSPEIIYDRTVKLRDTLSMYFTGVFDLEAEWFDERVKTLEEEI